MFYTNYILSNLILFRNRKHKTDVLIRSVSVRFILLFEEDMIIKDFLVK